MSTDASVPSLDPSLPPTGSTSYVGVEPGNSPAPSEAACPLQRECELVYQSLRQGVPPSDSPSHVVGVTSCYEGEGVTTVASQLALVAASSGRKVLLVDAHFASPALHQWLDGPLDPGLADAVAQGRPWTEIARQLPGKSITLVTAGTASPAASGSDPERMKDFVRYAEENYDFAVFDLPPLCRPADAIALYSLLQGVLLVVQAERVRWPVAKRFVADLERSGANTLGAVMNRRRQHIPQWLYRTL